MKINPLPVAFRFTPGATSVTRESGKTEPGLPVIGILSFGPQLSPRCGPGISACAAQEIYSRRFLPVTPTPVHTALRLVVSMHFLTPTSALASCKYTRNREEKTVVLDTLNGFHYFHFMSTLRDDIKRVFSVSGALPATEGFEYRSQQEAMATAVATALENRTHLMVEAPTGVGKTLAYLVPAVLHAVREKRRAIVSTHTKNLQDQLFQKDIPIVRALLDVSFNAVLFKGRRNYLCTTRLRNALAAPGSLFGKEATDQLSRMASWSGTTPDGDIDTMPFTPLAEVWDMVCSERGVCSPVVCGTGCHFQQLKERVRAADIIIMNHALFFSLMAMQDSSDRFIFDDDFVIFDEAHTVPSVASTGIGKSISRQQLLHAIHRLYNPRSKRGLLARQGRSARTICSQLETDAGTFFDRLAQGARSLGSGSAVRIRTPGLMTDSLADPLGDMLTELEKLETTARNPAVRQELGVVRRSLVESGQLISEFLEQTEPDFTYWIELSGREGNNVTLHASPPEVGGIIGPRLFKAGTSVIMTSATLAVNDELDYARARIGATAVEGLIVDSPFDHARQMRLCLARDIPEPDADDYPKELPAWVLRSILRTHGKALVLFTSASMMKSVAGALHDELNERGYSPLVQGENLPRHELLQAFKADIHSVLFGLDSFWMGIDVPGEALEHVIITRLPFAVPNHPLIEARLESITRRGGQAFLEYTLPEAVLKFRQGVGRLIRTRNDHGTVTILDSRILRKSYGRVFLGSIPRSPVDIMMSSGETEELQIEDW
jgi:ATP-dependent DNA helicase DinG